jgi:uncharacterized membrane protein YbhN (UPF0104 family)
VLALLALLAPATAAAALLLWRAEGRPVPLCGASGPGRLTVLLLLLLLSCCVPALGGWLPLLCLIPIPSSWAPAAQRGASAPSQCGR